MIMATFKYITCVYFIHITCTFARDNPNIVIIMADDLGWNDVGFHGSNQIPTPNIDALAYNGIILNRFYTQPACSPSRAALLSGQYPIRTGLQGYPIIIGENLHLPLDVPILPEKLKELGYSTHLVGKWHLGFAYKRVTPRNRGFDYHFGYWNGYIGYFNHLAEKKGLSGLDMHDNFDTVWSTQYEYATHLFTRKAKEVILAQNNSKPFFLMISHLAVHSGSGDTLEIPDIEENNRRFSYISDENRRLYAGMVSELDKSVGITVQALHQKNILDNTIILFISDNGAPTWGVSENWGSNWPLRGMKLTAMEGGVRNVGVLYYSKLKNKGIVNNDLVHISDMMPTIYSAAGGDVKNLGKIDGINHWNSFLNGEKSTRSELLVDLDEEHNVSAIIGENGRYKLINGSTYLNGYDGYYGESGRNISNVIYDSDAVIRSPTNEAINNGLTEADILTIRNKNNLEKCRKTPQKYKACNDGTFCLFDIINDPCETTDLAKEHSSIVEKLSKKLQKFRMESKPRIARFIDPKANPVYYNNTWITWLDHDFLM